MDLKLYLNPGLFDLLISDNSSVISLFSQKQISNPHKGLEGPL